MINQARLPIFALCASFALSVSCSKKEDKVTPDEHPPTANDGGGTAGGSIGVGGSSNGSGVGGGTNTTTETVDTPLPYALNLTTAASPQHQPYTTVTDLVVANHMSTTAEFYAPATPTKQLFATAEDKNDDQNATDPVSDCISAYKAASAVSAGKDYLALSFAGDATKCGNSAAGGTKYKYVYIVYQLLHRCSDEGVDYSSLDKRKLKDIDTSVLDNCKKWGDAVIIQHAERIQGSMEDNSGATHDVTFTHRKSQYLGTSEMKTCDYTEANNSVTLNNVCMNYLREDISDVVQDGKPETSYPQTIERLVNQTGVTYATTGNAPWYSSGSIDFYLNDWKANVTYSAPTQAPNYVLTNAAGQTFKGVLTDHTQGFTEGRGFNEGALTPANTQVIPPTLR